jgi:predicted PurR-regulated permease PerM
MIDPNTLALLSLAGISPENAESAITGFALATVLTLVTAIPTVMLARRKGRSVAFWLVLALSFPLLPLLVLWLLPEIQE